MFPMFQFYISAHNLKKKLFQALSVPAEDYKACIDTVGITNGKLYGLTPEY